MNSSMIRCCRARGRYIHVSKPVQKIKVKAPGGIAIEKWIVDPKPGVTRFTNPEAFARLGTRGRGVLHEAPH